MFRGGNAKSALKDSGSEDPVYLKLLAEMIYTLAEGRELRFTSEVNFKPIIMCLYIGFRDLTSCIS